MATNFRYGKKIFTWNTGAARTNLPTILAWFILQAVRQMPRSTDVLVGPTYIKMLTVTFPATKEGLLNAEIFASSTPLMLQ